MLIRSVASIALISILSVATLLGDIVGKWTASLNGKEFVLQIKSVGAEVTGTLMIPDADEPSDIRNGKLEGNKLSFEVIVKHEGQELKFTLSGSVSDTEIILTALIPGKGEAPPLTFTRTH